jgi:hypothetical protein
MSIAIKQNKTIKSFEERNWEMTNTIILGITKN